MTRLCALIILFISTSFVYGEEISSSNPSHNSELIKESEQLLLQGNFKLAKKKAEEGIETASDKIETAKAQLQLLKVSITKPYLRKADRQKIDALYLVTLDNASSDRALQMCILETMISYYDLSDLKEQSALVQKRKQELINATHEERERNENNQLKQLHQQLISLLDTNNALGSQVAAQKSRINNMNIAQAKAALNAALQKQLLDSMAMSSLMDAMRIQKQNMTLTNQADSLSKQQSALQLQRSERNVFMMVAAIILLLAVGLIFGVLQLRKHNATLNEKNEIIQQEKRNNEELLLNILPKAISDELKEHGAVRAKRYESVSVLFSDFVNFSGISETLTPEDLVRELDYCFKQFDRIVTKNGLEKIKTIGDAYMCAGGLPEDNDLHAEHAVTAAIEMQNFLEEWNAERKKNNLPEYHARIGINTGPLVAGVVGIKKFAYDIWGDTVNVASRMESSCEPNKINISGNTYSRVRDKFHCIYRGKIPVKNKGQVDMYFVSRLEAQPQAAPLTTEPA